MKNLTTWKSFLLNVYASIIAAIIVILFHSAVFNLFSGIWDWIQYTSVNIITSFSDAISDRFYRTCSQGYTRSDAAIMIIFLGILMFLTLKFVQEFLKYCDKYLTKSFKMKNGSQLFDSESFSTILSKVMQFTFSPNIDPPSVALMVVISGGERAMNSFRAEL